MDDDFKNKNLYSDEYKYVMYFDTIVTLKRILVKDCDAKGKFDYGIKGLDISALILIGSIPNKPMNFYSFKLNIENGSFNYIANKLHNLGFIDVIHDKKDKRKKFLVVTDKGTEVLTYHRKLMNDHIEQKLECLNEEERLLFASSLNTIRALALKLDE